MQTNSMRRMLLSSLAALALSANLPLAAQAASTVPVGTPLQVVYHVADGNEQASRALINANNHLKAEPDTRIVIVALGRGVDFLVEGAKDKSGNSYADAVAALATMGVQFRVCNNSLKAFKIDPAKLLMEAKVVSSGVAEITRLQGREGYAYLRP